MLNKNQERLLKELRKGNNVFIAGEAGTGKTFVLNKYIDECKQEGKNVIITAPTGIAALNLNGQTMHSAFLIPIPAYGHYDFDIKLSKIKPITIADVIIIDEISMCRVDVFEYFYLIIKKIKDELGKTIQIIVSGDFYQLPPIVKKEELPTFKRLGLHESGYCFTSPYWKWFKFKCIELTEIVRQENKEFIEELNKLRKGDTSCLSFFNKRVLEDIPNDAIYICSTNLRTNIINDNFLNELEGPKVCYDATREGFCAKEYTVEEHLILKKGAKVIFMANDVINEYYKNGSFGIIEKCSSKSVSVKLEDGKIIEVFPYEWTSNKITIVNGMTEKQKIGSFYQLPLKLAYAITMHKTQGQTYDKAIISPNSFADGQLYVAISRIRTIDGLYFDSEILPEYIKVNSLVNDFYENFKYEVPLSIINKKKTLEQKAKEKFETKNKKKTTKKTTTKKTTTKSKTTKKSSKNTTKSTSTKKTTTKKEPSSKGNKYYAVAKGRNIGIYTSWEECEKQVKRYPGAIYKSFKTKKEAQEYIANLIKKNKK